jgi:hypothetical protein
VLLGKGACWTHDGDAGRVYYNLNGTPGPKLVCGHGAYKIGRACWYNAINQVRGGVPRPKREYVGGL